MWTRLRRAAAKKNRPSQVRLSVESLEDRAVPSGFTAGNLVIYRVGDGSAGLGSVATAVFLDEYTPSGSLVQSIALPTSDSGSNQTLTSSGTAASEGLLTLSADGRYLILTGYDAALGTIGVSSTNSSSFNRVVGRVGADGTIDTSTTTTSFNILNIRGAASTNGTDIWMTGNGTGVVYTTLGSSGTGTVVSTTVTVNRMVQVFDNALYTSNSSGTNTRIGQIGTGAPPTSGANSFNGLPGFPTTGSPYQFFFADLSSSVSGVDTLYVADDGANAIQKFSLVSGNWTSNGSITASAVRGLTGVVSGTTVTLYGTTGGTGSTGGGTLYKYTDSTGYNTSVGSVSASSIATAGLNTSFRGVAFAPAVPNEAPVLSGANNFGAIDEDATTNGGTLVSALISGKVSDGNANALSGVAITATNTTNGSWEYTTNGGTNWTAVGSVSGTSALLLAADGSTKVRFVPNADFNGTVSTAITFRAWDQTSGAAGDKVSTSDNGGSTAFSSATASNSITVNPVADTPSVTNATTNEDTQTASGLKISRNAADDTEVTHFKITNIQNGTLFQNDGTTQITSGSFITFAEGNAGLKFTPNADFFGTGSFDVQASTSASDAGLGGNSAPATIAVNAVADTPSVTNAATQANTQTSSGLVIARNAADGAEVTHFKITNIANGALFLSDGSTQITNGSFVTFAQGNAGLKFTPDTDFTGDGSFAVQASLGSTDAGLGGGTETATITVTATYTPSASGATTDEDTQTTGGLVITVNGADGGTTTHYKITNVTGGTLYQNDGTTPIAAGTFITAAEGAAGLRFTPDADQNDDTGTFGFGVQASISNNDAGLRGSVVSAAVAVNPVNDEPTFDLGADVTVGEDSGAFGPTSFATNILRGPATATDESGQSLDFTVTNDNITLFAVQPDIDDTTGELTFTPNANAFGSATVTVTLTDGGPGTAPDDNTSFQTFTITVNAVADTPTVTNATTNEDTQTTTGLVISRNAADGEEVTHFKITNITNGTLFLNDGLTQLANGAFITFAQGNAGLKFTPNPNFFGTGSFQVQASTSADGAGLGGGVVAATITVNPVADTPSVTNATTNEDTQTTSGLVISRNAADGAEVTHFKITNITNGTLFQNDGTTPIADGDFITVAQGGAGLKFTPDANFFGTASFDVQASLANNDGGLGGSTVTATVTVNAIADTPSVTNATTNEDTQTTSGLVISRNAADGAEVTHFKVTNITNGTLFLNDGGTQIANGTFITFAQANAGLKFTPNPNFFGTGSFDVQASTGNTNAGLGGGVVTATITVDPVADTPTVTNATTNEDAQTAGGLKISRNAADGPEVTHFKITGITGGALFLDDGTTPVASGSFITFAQGNAGLKFTPAANLNSTFATFGFQVQASNGSTDAGLGGSTATATITVNAVNDEPSVVLAGNVTVDQDDGAVARDGFATFAPGGGSDEAGQTPSYSLSNTNNALFVVPPAIDATGRLTFTLRPGANGVALVTVNVFDSGPGAAPNDNAGAPKQFTITVTPAPVAQLGAVGSDSGTPARVRVLDPRTGAPVRDLSPYTGYTGGVRVAVGDVTGDGTADIITTTARGVGHVKVFDGATGAEVASFMPFGTTPSGLYVAAGDVDADGRADIVLGQEAGGSALVVVSGRTLQPLRSFDAYPGWMGGIRVAAGDVNRDGYADVAVVAGPGGNGHIKVFDGATGALVTSYFGYPGYFGEINLAMGDVNGDRRDEIITTAKNDVLGTHVKAVTAGGQEVLSFFAPTDIGTTIGFLRTSDVAVVAGQAARVAAADVNGDRLAEILLGDPPGAGGDLIALDGVTHAVRTNFPLDPLFDFGVFVDVA